MKTKQLHTCITCKFFFSPVEIVIEPLDLALVCTVELDVDGLLALAAGSAKEDTPTFVASLATLAGADASQGVALFLNNSRA